MSGSEVSSTWKFSHSGVVPTGNFRQFEENNMVMERENADGGASNSFIQNDKEEDYYYTTPISAQMSHSENKTRSIGEGRSASSSPVMEDTEDMMNDSPENSQDWDIEIEDSEMNGTQKHSKFNIRGERLISKRIFIS